MNPMPPVSIHAGSLRQLGAAVYDGLLILAVFMVVTFIPVALTGHDLSGAQIGPVFHFLHQLVLAGALALYYGHAWTHRGQTLGMKAWKIRIENGDGTALRWSRACVRLLIAAALWLTAISGVLDYMHRRDWVALLAVLPLSLSYLAAHQGSSGTITDRLSRTRIVRD